MEYKANIGLEVHVQLSTKTKMFCGCPINFGAAPNTQVCPVCLGYPGALPVINKEAIKLTVQTGLMLNCKIALRSKFDRKNYFYPDMPKNYQISQYDEPLCIGGELEIELENGSTKKIRLNRIHLEEDAAKNIHLSGRSAVDFNRAGIPLMEIVTKPDISTPEEAFSFLQALKRILLYGKISECNLEEGNMKCDVNCSIRKASSDELGTKTEIKNLNTFKGVLEALRYELNRQRSVLEKGERIVQETRRFDLDSGITDSLRTKEEAHDYRYFPDPDLMPIELSAEEITRWQDELPELPAARCKRLQNEYNLPEYDSKVLSADKGTADFFEKVAKLSGNFKAASNWIMTELSHFLTEKKLELKEIKLTEESLASLIKLIDNGVISSSAAKNVFVALCEKGGNPEKHIESMGLVQISDEDALLKIVKDVVQCNANTVSDIKAGKKAAFKFLVGQVMKTSKGRANPQIVNNLLLKELGISEQK
jgi:aspartyl-tRNA(Asn)/glutamyl-tRNA(Gln) amidotransferase subunit B